MSLLKNSSFSYFHSHFFLFEQSCSSISRMLTSGRNFSISVHVYGTFISILKSENILDFCRLTPVKCHNLHLPPDVPSKYMTIIHQMDLCLCISDVVYDKNFVTLVQFGNFGRHHSSFWKFRLYTRDKFSSPNR